MTGWQLQCSMNPTQHLQLAASSAQPLRPLAQPRFRPPPWTRESPAWQQLDQRLPDDHLARQVAAAVEQLDLRPLINDYANVGSAAHPPDLLLKAILYELHLGRQRPAQWYQDAKESEPLRWLLFGLEPSRARWYAFRDRLPAYHLAWNRQVLQQAQQQGLTTATRGALDGTLVAAHASRRRLFNGTKMQQRLAALEQAVAIDENRVAPDSVAPNPVAPRPAWMATSARGRRHQRRRYRQALQRVAALDERNAQKRASKRKAPDKILVSPADPQAAVSRDKEGVFRPLYNVQTLVDLDSPLVLAYEVFAQPNDEGTLAPLLERHTQLHGHRPEAVLTDSAYASGAQLASAESQRVTLYAPCPAEAAPVAASARRPPQIPKSQFRWDGSTQTYICPEGQRLELVGQSAQKRSGPELVVLAQYRCPPVHCQACARQRACTPSPAKGRTISRSEYEESIERLRARMATAPAQALYKRRRETVERIYADFKEHRQLRRFYCRGLARVRTLVGLNVLVHNLLVVSRAPAAQPPPAPQPALAPQRVDDVTHSRPPP